MTRRESLQVFLAALALVMLPKRLFAVATTSEWTPEVIALAHRTEASYGLPRGICRAMNMQENSGRLAAAVPKVEPAYFDAWGKHTKETQTTARLFIDNHEEHLSFYHECLQLATSWGPWQLLGINLRNLGCEKADLSDVTLEEHFEYWARFYSAIWHRAHGDLYKACRFYNGPQMKPKYYTNVKRWLALYA